MKASVFIHDSSLSFSVSLSLCLSVSLSLSVCLSVSVSLSLSYTHTHREREREREPRNSEGGDLLLCVHLEGEFSFGLSLCSKSLWVLQVHATASAECVQAKQHNLYFNP